MGELALSGELRAISGVLPDALAANREKHKRVVLERNLYEAHLVGTSQAIGSNHLPQVCAF